MITLGYRRPRNQSLKHGVKLTIGFATMSDTADLNDVAARADEEEPVIADP